MVLLLEIVKPGLQQLPAASGLIFAGPVGPAWLHAAGQTFDLAGVLPAIFGFISRLKPS